MRYLDDPLDQPLLPDRPLSPEEVHYLDMVLKIGEEVVNQVVKICKENAKLNELIRKDYKTKLPNELSFDEWTESILEESPTELWIVCIDIDGLKAINDEHGHQAGDKTLIKAANTLDSFINQVLAGSTRKDDTKLARLHGDEFIIGIAGLPEDRIRSIIEELSLRLKTFAVTAEGLIVEADDRDAIKPISASFGYAKYVEGEPIADTRKRADQAMYEAKPQKNPDPA